MTTKTDIYKLLESFEERLTGFIISKKMAGKEDATSLLDEIKGIKDIFETLEEDEVFSYKETSIIDRLKLGANTIALKNADYSDAETAEVLSTQTGQVIITSDVTKWLESYSNIQQSQPSAIRGSVFDTQSRMQDIMEQLYDHLEKIRMMDEEKFARAKTTRAQVELDTYKEIRQLTKDAAQIINAVSAQHRFKEFQQSVVEAISSVSPQVGQQIMRKLREQKVLMNSLIPPT